MREASQGGRSGRRVLGAHGPHPARPALTRRPPRPARPPPPEPTERTAAMLDDTRTLTRTDEAGFRAAVPREVGGLTILAVSRYHPGGTGFFASAIAVAEGDPGGFSTHQLVYDDDRDQWHVMVGHYLFASRDEADRDAAERVAWS